MIDIRFYQRLGPVSLVELLNGLDAVLPEGQFGDIQIENAGPVDQAGTGEVTYFKGPKAAAALAGLSAEACFITEENAAFVGASNSLALVTPYPRADFARALGRLYRPRSYSKLSDNKFAGVQIAKGAVIAAGAEIGKGSVIGPNAAIGSGVKLGENCRIGANAVVEFAIIGNNCVINNGAVIGGTGFGVAVAASGGIDIPHVGRVVLEDNVSVGCVTTIDRAMFGDTYVGQGSKFDNHVQIAHNCRIGENCMFAAFAGVSGSCIIGNGVIMGGRAGLADHLAVGDNAVMAANCGVMHNIPSGEMWSGFPAQPIREHMREVATLRKLAKPKKNT